MSSEEGSAPVGFLFSAILLLVAFLSVLQVAQVMHQRNVLIDIAGEGARQAARFPSDLANGQSRINELAHGAVTVEEISGSYEQRGDNQIVVFTVTSSFPILGTEGIAGGITVRGRALVEQFEN